MFDPLLFAILLACFTTFVTILFFAAIADGLGLIDDPEGRKQHGESTPMVGGIGIVAGLMTLFFTMPEFFSQYWVIFACVVVLMFLGIIDDFSHVHSAVRMLIQIAVGVALHFEANLPFLSVGDIWFIGDLGLGPYALTFTCIAVVGGINAINMMDGLDGLCGLIVGSAIFYLAILAWLAGDETVFYFSSVLLSLIVVFLVLNYRFPWNERARIFLGNSGAYVFGFLIAALFLMATQGKYMGGVQVLTPVTALWLLFLPLIDIAHVIWVRSRAGRWPISDDRLHVHYLLRDTGFSTEQVVNRLFCVALVLGGIGVTLYHLGVSESWSFVVFMGFCTIYFLATNRMAKNALPSGNDS